MLGSPSESFLLWSFWLTPRGEEDSVVNLSLCTLMCKSYHTTTTDESVVLRVKN